MSNPREDSYGDDANEAENPGGARLQAEDPSIVRATDLNGSRIHFHKQRPRTDHIARGGQHRTRNSPEATNMICDFCLQALAVQAHPVPAMETSVRPDGIVSVTVTVPEVGPVLTAALATVTV